MSLAPYDSLNLGGAVGDNRDAVAQNRARVATAAGLPPERVVWMRQVHGTTVAAVHGAAASDVRGATAIGGIDPESAECDGVVTSDRGLGLAVLVADCVPIRPATRSPA